MVEIHRGPVPYLFVIAAFTFVYMFVPNTRVRLGSAASVPWLAGFLWQTVGWGFASFVVASAKYAAIYSGFAILVIFMLWLYLAWLILLVGASIAFYHQHPEYLTMRRRELNLSNRLKERTCPFVDVLDRGQATFAGPAPGPWRRWRNIWQCRRMLWRASSLPWRPAVF